MGVAKREISLTEALGLYLSYTPNYNETDQFRTDLRTLNHTLLRDSIKECVEASKTPQAAPNSAKRAAIHLVYCRKVKELASLYPYLFSVESALRSTATELYTNVFTNPKWWLTFLTAYNNNHDEKHFPRSPGDKRRVDGIDVTSNFIKNIFFSFGKMTARQRSTLIVADCPGDQYLAQITLRDLFNIMESDWGLCPVGSLNKTDFRTHMVTICDARNEVFHGNPIKNRTGVYKACERILDAVNIHIGALDDVLKDTKFQRPNSTLPRSPRHCIPPHQ